MIINSIDIIIIQNNNMYNVCCVYIWTTNICEILFFKYGWIVIR